MQSIFFATLAVITSAGTELTLTTPAGRDYIVYNPGGTNLPLVLAFHGMGDDAVGMRDGTELNKSADRQKFIVVYPNGYLRGGIRQWRVRKGDSSDDISFTKEILKETEKRFKHDAKRVYAVGMSYGGMFCYRLAAEESGLFAAVGVVGGSMETPASATARPVPLIHIHGGADPVVRSDGKASTGLFPGSGFDPACSTQDAIDAYVNLHGAKKKSTTNSVVGKFNIARDDYFTSKPELAVSLIMIDKGGHLWPGHKTPAKFLAFDLGETPQDPKADANVFLWEFLKPHSLP